MSSKSDVEVGIAGVNPPECHLGVIAEKFGNKEDARDNNEDKVKKESVVAPPETHHGVIAENFANKEDVHDDNEDELKKESAFAAPRHPVVAKFIDHFSLTVPSSQIRFRLSSAGARIIESDDDQFVMEEKYNEETRTNDVTLKKIGDSSEGLRSLRCIYAIAAAFFAGFVFIFSLQILLYMALDLAIALGHSSARTTDFDIPAVTAVILSFPLYVYSLATGLVMVTAFVMDTWKGHRLMRNFTFRKRKPVEVEWFFFAFFAGIPICVLSITLMMQIQSWSEITILFWLGCVAIFFLLFSINVIFYEVSSCFKMVKNYYNEADATICKVLSQCIILRQVATYSARKDVTYLSLGPVGDSEETDGHNQENEVPGTRVETKSFQAHLCRYLCFIYKCGWYEELVPPQQVYSVEVARDVRPFVTSHSWSLDKMFCRPTNSRYVAIVQGPGAITKGQMISSVVCSFIGTFLILFLLIGILVYFEVGKVKLALALVLFAILAFPRFRSAFKLYKSISKLIFASKEMKKSHDSTSFFYSNESTAESTAFYTVTNSHRINKPSRAFCCSLFAIEVSIFYLFPLFGMFSRKSYGLGSFFLVNGALSGIRYYVNSALVLEEVGDMSLMVGKNERDTWVKQSRLDDIVGNVSRGRSHSAWLGTLGAFSLIVFALFVWASVSGTNAEAKTKPLILLKDFEYKHADDSVRYPSCQLASSFGKTFLRSLPDFAFLSKLAYFPHNETQHMLDEWFGVDQMGQIIAIDSFEVVRKWKENNINDETSAAVSFKLITFPNFDNYAFVSIRGTISPWDMLTDAQLWMPALLLQLLRLFLPLGFIWTPVMTDLVKSFGILESSSIEKISFYGTTTKFVNFLQDTGTYGGVAVTGHSLGGGLALITGAQTHVPGIGLSAPNAMLSRKSFNPPVESEALNSKTFNIIPARDVVPMADDRAQNYQQIDCTADQSDIIGCHSAVRSLCELQFNCGSGKRPVPCDCVLEFGYPEPLPKAGTNRTFAEACAAFVPSE